MNSILALISALVISIETCGQLKLTLLMEKWDVGAAKKFNGTTLLRVEGANTKDRVTNIAYQKWADITHNSITKAKLNSGWDEWSEEEKNDFQKKIDSTFGGGAISVYVEKNNMVKVHGKIAVKFHYTVIITAVDSSEVFRDNVDLPDVEKPWKGRTWWSYFNVGIRKTIQPPFIIEITDRTENLSYKFLYKGG